MILERIYLNIYFREETVVGGGLKKQSNREVEVSITGDLGILVVSRRRVHARA